MSERKGRKQRVIEPGGPEDREFHLERVFATFNTEISPAGAERLVELLGDYRVGDEGQVRE